MENENYIQVKRLVRNKIPDFIRNNKKKMIYFNYPLMKDFELEIINTINTHFDKFVHNQDKNKRIEELANIWELLEALTKQANLSEAEVLVRRVELLKKYGDYSDRVYLVDIDE
jgi:predicted house-cleaning noncanonical NTP pyrophosphatase (MazG superfamily)